MKPPFPITTLKLSSSLKSCKRSYFLPPLYSSRSPCSLLYHGIGRIKADFFLFFHTPPRPLCVAWGAGAVGLWWVLSGGGGVVWVLRLGDGVPRRVALGFLWGGFCSVGGGGEGFGCGSFLFWGEGGGRCVAGCLWVCVSVEGGRCLGVAGRWLGGWGGSGPPTVRWWGESVLFGTAASGLGGRGCGSKPPSKQKKTLR